MKTISLNASNMDLQYPGVTLLEQIEEMGISQLELSQRISLDKKTVNLIIKGKAPISPETAIKLEDVTDVSASFWMNLESNYQTQQARAEKLKLAANDIVWARQFPYPAMAKKGWVSATQKGAEKVINLYKFFGVSSVQAWESIYESKKLSLQFRRSQTVSEKIGMITAWLRHGEIDKSLQGIPEFDAKAFEKKTLPRLRKKALEHLSLVEFKEVIHKECYKAGVAYFFEEGFPGMGVSGVMHWVNDTPVIQQTSRFKTNDSLWFTFFHEAKHVLQIRKKGIFVSGSKIPQDDQIRENEADLFARNYLIPEDDYTNFLQENSKFTSPIIKRFAKSISMHPGVVVGRLMRDQVLPYSHPSRVLKNFK